MPAMLVKRDDLTGFAVAGNKARQLEFLVAEALAAGADTLVTGGTPGRTSSRPPPRPRPFAGLRCTLVLARRRDGADVHPNLRRRRVGRQVRWTGDPDRSSVDRALSAIGPELPAQGACPTSSPRWRDRHRRARLPPRRRRAARAAPPGFLAELPVVVCPPVRVGRWPGSSPGAVARGRPLRAVGARSAVPGGPRTADPHARAGGRRPARRTPPTPDDVSLVDARGPGHAVPSPEGAAAADAALRCAGLVLDPVYTAKALAVLPAASGGRPVVFWHTGGLLDAVAA